MIQVTTYSQDMLTSLLESIHRLERENTIEEIKQYLEENNSYLLAEFRPQPKKLQQVLDTLSKEQVLVISDSLDSLFLEYLFLKYSKI